MQKYMRVSFNKKASILYDISMKKNEKKMMREYN